MTNKNGYKIYVDFVVETTGPAELIRMNVKQLILQYLSSTKNFDTICNYQIVKDTKKEENNE